MIVVIIIVITIDYHCYYCVIFLSDVPHCSLIIACIRSVDFLWLGRDDDRDNDDDG